MFNLTDEACLTKYSSIQADRGALFDNLTDGAGAGAGDVFSINISNAAER